MDAALKFLKGFEKTFVVTLTIAMVFVTFLQVIFRVFLDNPLAWSEELSRYLFVWIVFIGGAWAVSGDAHFKMDFLTTVVPDKYKKVLDIFSSICMIAFALIMVVYGWRLAMSVNTQLSPALRVKMTIPYSALPISGLLIIIHAVELIISNVKKPKLNGKED